MDNGTMKLISQGKTLMLTEAEWVKCPYCKQKTRTKAFSDTVLLNFPLYCPKCKQETLVNVKNTQLSVIRLNNLIFKEDNKL